MPCRKYYYLTAATIVQYRLINKNITGIEIATPSMGYVDILPKALLGIDGAFRIMKKIINGIYYR
jgi:hypothetical protein